jgi:hypothetical protein
MTRFSSNGELSLSRAVFEKLLLYQTDNLLKLVCIRLNNGSLNDITCKRLSLFVFIRIVVGKIIHSTLDVEIMKIIFVLSVYAM